MGAHEKAPAKVGLSLLLVLGLGTACTSVASNTTKNARATASASRIPPTSPTPNLCEGGIPHLGQAVGDNSNHRPVYRYNQRQCRTPLYKPGDVTPLGSSLGILDFYVIECGRQSQMDITVLGKSSDDKSNQFSATVMLSEAANFELATLGQKVPPCAN